jgi:hypothetical protein
MERFIFSVLPLTLLLLLALSTTSRAFVSSVRLKSTWNSDFKLAPSSTRSRVWFSSVRLQTGRNSDFQLHAAAQEKDEHSAMRTDNSLQQQLLSTAGPLAVSSALLGPILDNFHSVSGVLSYVEPKHIDILGKFSITTDTWVPPLFAVAGVGIGSIYLSLDELLDTPPEARDPSIPRVALCIVLFIFQYYMSGLLFQAHFTPFALGAWLAALAGVGFISFDGTVAGLTTSSLTAILGPLVEIVLINGFHLYTYAEPDFLGVPDWIPIVYFLGGPAVGGLARVFNSRRKNS